MMTILCDSPENLVLFYRLSTECLLNVDQGAPPLAFPSALSDCNSCSLRETLKYQGAGNEY
jgi:hypothetical protein